MKAQIRLGRIFGIEIDLDQLPVVRDGRIEGVISRSGVLRLLQACAAVDM
jgi:CBS domain-containing protein